MKIYEKIKRLIKRYREYTQNDIEYENAKIILKNDANSILIDVRSPQEYKENHLENSVNIPLYDLSKNIEKIYPDKNKTIIVYCQSGNRSKKAIEILHKQGYENVYNIAGGLDNI